jgi:hypothetical protein
MFVMLPRSPAESTLAPRDAVPGGARPRTAPGRRGSDRAENESVVDGEEPATEPWEEPCERTAPAPAHRQTPSAVGAFGAVGVYVGR